MAKPFQKRRANEIVGVFVLLTLGILIAAAILGPHTQRWFTPTRKLAIRLPPEGSLGLRKGADVLILGSVVGSVDDISVNDAGEMEAEISIRGNFIRFVRRDSRAFIRKSFGIGDASIEITRGSGEPLPARDAAIQSFADKAPTQMLEETLAEIRIEAVPALRDLRTAVAQYTHLASDLRGQQPGVAQAIAHFNDVIAQVQDGKGVAGMLLSDPAPANTLRESLPKISASIDDLKAMTATLRKVSANLPEMQQSAQRALDQTPELLLQFEETARKVEQLAQVIEHNWLLGGGAPAAVAAPSRISADRVGTDR